MNRNAARRPDARCWKAATIHIPDMHVDPDYTFVEAKELGGFRTILAVPMLRDGIAIGVLALTRIDMRPFTDKQIELLRPLPTRRRLRLRTCGCSKA